MLRSLQLLQVGLQVEVLLLVVVAGYLRSWNVIYFKSVDESRSNNPAFVQQLSFSPNGYCLRLTNGSSDCQPFLSTILENSRQPNHWPNAVPDSLAVLPSLVATGNGSDESLLLAQALSSWCHTRGELTWYMQGAQNVACLVVLETTKYAMVLWGVFAMLSVGLSSRFLPREFASCHAFCSFTSLMLGLLAILVWWYYSSTYIDREYLMELTLDWYHGASFYCALAALVLAAINAQIAFDDSSICGTRNHTRLHVLPPSGFRQSEDLDPMSCPANYVV